MADIITIDEMGTITAEDLKQRILGRFTTDLQTREGSFTNDVISALALELCNCYHSIAALLPMCILRDFTGAMYPLTALITLCQAGNAVVLAFITDKSKAENTKGGITYDMAIKPDEPDI